MVGIAGIGGAAAGYLAFGRRRRRTVVREVGATGGADGASKVFVLPGSTSATAVNDAIDAAAEAHGGGGGLPGGGLVLVGGGDVEIDRPVVLRPGVVLAGTGWGTKLIRGFDGGPMITFQADGGAEPGAYGAEVRDLFLVGGQAAYRDAANVGILLDATNPKGHGWTDPNCRIHGVRVAYCAGHGIVVASHPGSDGTTSRACLVADCFVERVRWRRLQPRRVGCHGRQLPLVHERRRRVLASRPATSRSPPARPATTTAVGSSCRASAWCSRPARPRTTNPTVSAHGHQRHNRHRLPR